MRLTRLYQPVALAADTEVALDERAAHHVARVLRMKPGMEVLLFDGAGTEARATLTEVSKRGVVAQVHEPHPRHSESPLRLVLGQGISKGDRMDFTLQKSVELGVAEIVPLWTRHSQVQLDAKRLAKRMAHWQGVIIGACEQSGRTVLPRLEAPMSVAAWLATKQPRDTGLLLDPEQGGTLGRMMAPEGTVYLLVGPEGGLAPEECEQAKDAGFTGVGLGPRVLRTETAAMAAIACLQVLWGDFQ